MKNVILIYGGNTTEHDISVITAIQIMNNINKDLYNLIPLYIYENKFFTIKNATNIEYYKIFNQTLWKEVKINNGYIVIRNFINKSVKIDACIIACHGGIYEGGGLQGLLEINNIPYTSCGIFQSSICMDKAKSKLFFKDLGVNCLDCILLKKDDFLHHKKQYIDNILSTLTLPIIVKPNDQGSSIGINISKTKEELISNIIVAFAFSNNVIVEHALTNFTEFNCAGLRSNIGLFISDIEKPTIIKDYLTFENKYTSLEKEVEFPAKITKELELEIKQTTKKLFNYLNLSGVCRCDYLYDNINSKLYINEINTVPGSLAFYLFNHKLKFNELLNVLIETAIKENKCKNKNKIYKTDVLSHVQNSLKTPFIK